MTTHQAAKKLGVQIRPVVAQDAPALERLAAENHYFEHWRSADGSPIEIDWAGVYPYWFGAQYAGSLVAAVQFLPGRPMSRMEDMLVRQDQRQRVKAIAVAMLLLACKQSAHDNGSQLMAGLCPDWRPDYKRVLIGMGALSQCEGSIMIAEV